MSNARTAPITIITTMMAMIPYITVALEANPVAGAALGGSVTAAELA